MEINFIFIFSVKRTSIYIKQQNVIHHHSVASEMKNNLLFRIIHYYSVLTAQAHNDDDVRHVSR